MGLSLYTLKVTSVSEFQSLQAGYVYFRGVPLDTDKRQTTAKVVFAKVKREFNFEVRHSPMPPDGTLRIP